MRYFTAGESHGPELTAIIDGLPAGIPISVEEINHDLKRRQGGYGRGGRMLIETDTVEITSGVRHGKTLGSPITLVVKNDDFKNWETVMGIDPVDDRAKKMRRLSKPRPGHADLVGGIKFEHDDLRNVLERSSARETTMRVAIAAICKQMLRELDVEVASHVLEIGGVRGQVPERMTVVEIQEKAENSVVRCVDPEIEEAMKEKIDQTKKDKNTIGGVVEVVIGGVPIGLGSHTQWDTKLDGKIAQAVVSINAFKGVEFGVGFEAARLYGSEVMDEIIWSKEDGYTRTSNNLGGFEGGMTNGMPIVVRGVMKPIPTLYKPLQSVDIDTKEVYKASVERSDSSAVPAASVVAEAMVTIEVAKAMLDKFESDSFNRMKDEVKRYREYTLNF
ncbi:chorismate synthase [Vagococcus fluvialis]|uniref:chorismate synthase n=1 Tax=Vagococcus fluvialis TaxID=2738 RepID=UPI001A8FA07A|nr:chorismate synthase [Vagococcus fluvialis]MBO0478922.1 chorismate synthase [Vagococcus fluvialis]MBO0483996.1 chorismate synthase [Vagococcus fluvialis]MCM2137616.1 chorismate synthase [Vagococcus fluvialis]MDT2746313.1 chorismate synthase [Vagococcus fluvialis]MDT2781110.1 chorismate synthase [Vagococcus fluvialis]